MRKLAKPGLDPEARLDVKTDARTPVVEDEIRPAHAEETFGVSGLNGSSDDLNLKDAWLVEHARHGDHQAFAVLVRRYEAQTDPRPDAVGPRAGTGPRPGAETFCARLPASRSV